MRKVDNSVLMKFLNLKSSPRSSLLFVYFSDRKVFVLIFVCFVFFNCCLILFGFRTYRGFVIKQTLEGSSVCGVALDKLMKISQATQAVRVLETLNSE